MRNFIIAIVAVLLLGVTGSVYALSLQQAEINGNGKLGFSFDNGDGIIWLDNNVTRGKTVAEMNILAADYGLQWANENMVITLHENLMALTGGWTSSDSSITRAADFMDSNFTQSQLNGFFLDETPYDSDYSYQITEWWVTQYTDSTPDSYHSRLASVWVNEDYFHDNVGGWLYKMADGVSPVGSPVPEPGTILLFGIGCLSMAGYSRKRKL